MLVGITSVLAIVCVLHLALTFALIRRLRTLQELLTGSVEPLPAPGTAIGAFEAVSSSGEVLSDSLLREAPMLVGFFAPGCGPCDKACQELLAKPPRLPLLAFVAGADSNPEARALGESLAPIARVAYTTPGHSVNQAFRPTSFPSLFRCERGLVAKSGHAVSDVFA